MKASVETHGDVGDRTNDLVRVNGSAVRAKVVGEGGNLGFTQRGRIEYARAGGRINTDFIDNSAGVDTSDHEVNWKILLGLAIQRGELTLETSATSCCRTCAPDVVQHVLYDNYLQAQILSQEEGGSAQRIEAYEELMQQLEADGELERAVEFMPTTDDMAERRAAGQGMTRPELAVLLAYAKRQVYAELLESDLPDTEYLAADLARYFPPRIVERFGHLIADHPLKRQIIATMASNDVVNSQGITFASRMVTETGAVAVRSGACVPDRARRHRRDRAVERRRGPRRAGRPRAAVRADERRRLAGRDDGALVPRAGAPGSCCCAIGPSRRVVRRGVGGDQSDRPRRVAGGARAGGAALIEAGCPRRVAHRHAFQPELVHAPDIIAVAHATGRAPLEIARGFFVLGERLDIDWLEQQLEKLPAATRWQRWAQQSMEDDLFALRRRLCERVLELAGGAGIDEAIERFFEDRAQTCERVMRFLRGLKMEGVSDLSQLTVAVRQLRSIAG